jgi:hypothetical protein
MLLMLVDTPDPRYRGDPDPDEERERRWEPIGARLLVPAAGSLSCFAIAPFGGPIASWALTAAGIALCAQFVRVSLRDRDVPQRGDRTSPAGDERD